LGRRSKVGGGTEGEESGSNTLSQAQQQYSAYMLHSATTYPKIDMA